MLPPTDPDSVTFPIAKPATIAPYLFCAVMAAITVGLTAFILVMSFAPGFVRFVVDSEGVRVMGDLYGPTLPWDKLRTEQAAPVDPAHRAHRRTNGLGLPDYASGWFELKNGNSGLLFVSDWAKAVVIPTTEGYDLILSPETPDRFLASIKGRGTPNGRFGIARPVDVSPASYLIYAPMLITVGVAVLLIRILRAIDRTTVVLGPDSLAIRGVPFYSRSIPRASIRSDEARLDDDLKGMWKSNGIGLPGYLAGWFRKFKGGSYLMVVTDRARTVSVPTSAGYTLLFSPEDPDGFLQALRKPARIP